MAELVVRRLSQAREIPYFVNMSLKSLYRITAVALCSISTLSLSAQETEEQTASGLSQALANTYWTWPDPRIHESKGWFRLNSDGTATAGWHNKRHSWKAVDGSTIEYEITLNDNGLHRLRFNKERTEATQVGGKYPDDWFGQNPIFRRLTGPSRTLMFTGSSNAANKFAGSAPTSVPPPAVRSTPAPRSATNVLVDDPFIGRWRWNNATITTILPGGYARNGAPGRPEHAGTWTRDGSTYTINWTGGLFVDRVMIRGKNELWRKGNDNRWRNFAKRLE